MSRKLLDFVNQPRDAGKLEAIAANMILFARQHPYTEGQPLLPYRRELPRGLALTYVIESGQHHLALTRRGVAPSDLEVDICRRAFNVPAWADRHGRQKGDHHHVSLSWRDTEPKPPLITIQYPGDAGYLALPAGQWRRDGDTIVVAYQDRDELFWSVECSRLLKEVLEQPKTVEQSTFLEERGHYYG